MSAPVRRPRKAEAALSLRLAGATYDEIADALNYTDAAAALLAVEKMLAAQADDESKARMRQIASYRYERLIRAIWPKAIDPNNAEQIVAVRTARELIERHVALHGLAVPSEVIVRSPTQSELEAWVAEVSRIAMPRVIEYDITADHPALEGEVDSA